MANNIRIANVGDYLSFECTILSAHLYCVSNTLLVTCGLGQVSCTRAVAVRLGKNQLHSPWCNLLGYHPSWAGGPVVGGMPATVAPQRVGDISRLARRDWPNQCRTPTRPNDMDTYGWPLSRGTKDRRRSIFATSPSHPSEGIVGDIYVVCLRRLPPIRGRDHP